MSKSPFITGIEKVVTALGYWPSFHDAEVLSFSVERAVPINSKPNIARLTVIVREYAPEGEGTSQYKLAIVKSALIHFIMVNACDVEMSEFNHQNVINSISVSEISSTDVANLLVTIESIWGMGATFRCSSIEVESIEVFQKLRYNPSFNTDNQQCRALR